MNNTVQAHRKGGTKARSPQPEIPAEFSLTSESKCESCLAIFNRKAGAVTQKIPLTDDEFLDIAKLTIHVPMKEAIADAIRKAQSPAPTFPSPQQRCLFVDLKDAVLAASTLLMMLAAQNESKGEMTLATQVWMKLDSDLAAFEAAVETPVTQSAPAVQEVAS